MNILFTCAGRRNYLLRYFKKALQGKGKIVAIDSQLSAPAMAEADISIQVPSVFDPGYIGFLLAIIVEHRITAIISLNDLELPILAKHRNVLEQYGAKLLVSDEAFLDISFDKWKTFHFFKKADILTPQTFLTIDETLKAIKMNLVNYPLILKPRWGSASIGIETVENETELLLTHQLLKLKIAKSILKNTCLEDNGNCIIFQEKIDAPEYGMDILNDFKGNHYRSFVRKKMTMRSGETDRAISVIDNDFLEAGKKVGNATRHLGNMDCDFFVKDNKIYFLEMNPRFGGGYPFSHEAGIDIPSIYVSWLNENFDVAEFDNYKADLAFSKFDTLVSTTMV
jgi:carbamoyl-phosphate synthase large subunit